MRSTVLGWLFALVAAAAPANIVSEVRAAIGRKDLAAGERLVETYRTRHGITPEMLEALSWLGRGALAAKSLDDAERYATQTRHLSLEALKTRELDAERRLPIALGASIEVQAHVLDARAQRAEAVVFLRKELAAWRHTSIRTRIQKNLHLLSLEGKQAPPLEIQQWINAPPPAKLAGRPVLLFFWAHWCGDCKGQASALARLQETYGPKGLLLIGPTQRYGYTARGQDATPQQETAYIAQILKEHYTALTSMPVPLSEENFHSYGASTTPTLVLLDASGIVRLYHPGAMPYDSLAAYVESVIPSRSAGI